MAKVAFITGVTGQDGAYLTRLLLGKGYTVVAGHRRTSTSNFWRLERLGVKDHPRLKLVDYDLLDPGNSIRILQEHKPAEVYNLAAQSFVAVSFEQPALTAQTTGLSALHLLEAIRIVDPDIRFYQASTSEMFGKVQQTPQCEDTPFYPRSPYGVAKLFAHWATINYRESYGIFGTSGILFNHESPLRGEEFVTRKITSGVARICAGDESPILLGNLDAKRDWGYADDYVDGMYRMLQFEEPETFVLATGTTVSVRDFVRMAFESAGRPIEFSGEGVDEVAHDKASGKRVVEVTPAFFRRAEVELLIGDPAKAKEKLGWEATTSLERLISLMVESDLNRSKRAS